MKTYKVVKQPSSGNDRLVVITPDTNYLVCRQKGYYIPVKRKGTYVIEPNGVEFSVVSISAEKLSSLEKENDVAIIETNIPNPDLHALRLKFDQESFKEAAYLFNRYLDE